MELSYTGTNKTVSRLYKLDFLYTKVRAKVHLSYTVNHATANSRKLEKYHYFSQPSPELFLGIAPNFSFIRQDLADLFIFNIHTNTNNHASTRSLQLNASLKDYNFTYPSFLWLEDLPGHVSLPVQPSIYPRAFHDVVETSFCFEAEPSFDGQKFI